MSFSIIAGVSKNYGIGLDGRLPWKNKTDMKYFKDLTLGNAVIMGRKTLEGLKKPLPDRINVCISSNFYMGGVLTFKSLEEALEHLYPLNINIFVIGGETLYRSSMKHPDCKEIIINEIDIYVECDTFFPPIENFVLSSSKRIDAQIVNKRFVRL